MNTQINYSNTWNFTVLNPMIRLKRKIQVAIVVFMILLSVFVVSFAFCENVAIDSVSFSVFLDGYVFVESKESASSELPQVLTSVFGEAVTSLFVADDEGLPLESALNGTQLTVYTLGVEHYSVSYYTQDLTHKSGRFWSFSVSSPVNCSVHLPPEATVVGFNKIPDLLEGSPEELVLFMSAGETEISYIVGLVGTKEYAQVVLDGAEQVIVELEGLYVNLTNARVLLDQGWEYFNEGNFFEAENLGKQAKEIAFETNQTFAQALATISLAEAEIARIEFVIGGSLSNEASDLLVQAKDVFDGGDYALALSLASESYAGLLEFDDGSVSGTPTPSAKGGFPVFEGAAGLLVIVVVCVAAYLFWRRHQTLAAVRQSKNKQILQFERITKRNQLRKEEQDAVRLLFENNGELLEAQLYEKLNLPRTSTWRLVRRLQKMGVVEITKNRRDNVVKLRK